MRNTLRPEGGVIVDLLLVNQERAVVRVHSGDPDAMGRGGREAMGGDICVGTPARSEICAGAKLALLRLSSSQYFSPPFCQQVFLPGPIARAVGDTPTWCLGG